VHQVIGRYNDQLVPREVVIAGVDDGNVQVRPEQGLKRFLDLVGIGSFEVLPRGAGRSVRVRSDEGIEGIGDGYLGARVPRKSEFRELLEFRSNPRKLVDLPRWRSVVVEKSEQRLLFSANMTVEGPRQNRLRTEQQGLEGVHTA